MIGFALDRRLEADTAAVATLPLCVVRLMDDRRFPWLILVPARPGAVEIVDLEAADRTALIEEVAIASRVLREVATPAKLNVAALGNVVPQLHVHVVARAPRDAAWPGPVWGTPRAAYAPDAREAAVAGLRARFAAAGY